MLAARYQRMLLFSLLLLMGCGGGGSDKWTENLPETVEARGTILIDGKPLEGAAIVLAPVATDGHVASGLSGSGGMFILKAFPSKDGAVAGAYQVAVTRSEAGDKDKKAFDWGADAAHYANAPATEMKNTLPETYANPAKSGLTLEIPAGGVSDLKIELKSTPAT